MNLLLWEKTYLSVLSPFYVKRTNPNRTQCNWNWQFPYNALHPPSLLKKRKPTPNCLCGARARRNQPREMCEWRDVVLNLTKQDIPKTNENAPQSQHLNLGLQPHWSFQEIPAYFLPSKVSNWLPLIAPKTFSYILHDPLLSEAVGRW